MVTVQDEGAKSDRVTAIGYVPKAGLPFPACHTCHVYLQHGEAPVFGNQLRFAFAVVRGFLIERRSNKTSSSNPY